MGLSTHVLDTAAGKPASGVSVTVDKHETDEVWTALGRSRTDDDGRIHDLLGLELEAGVYRLTFEVGDYFPDGFYPEVTVTFRVADVSEHHHVPLLLSPFGYSTYRGS